MVPVAVAHGAGGVDDHGHVQLVKRYISVTSCVDVEDKGHVADAWVGFAVSGGAGEIRQGQTTSQLQFSK